MRIRKRTPARAASPGPEPLRAATFSPPPPPPPHPPQQQHHPKQERPQEEQQVEEKASLVIVGAGEQDEDRVLAAVSKNRTTDVAKPDPEPAARCSRNDGKQWRCKGAAVQGYLFCDRHVAWSTRKRKPRASRKNRGGRILDGSERAKEEEAAEGEDAVTSAATNLQCNGGGGGGDDDDGFYYYGGFQPGSRKRVKSSAAGPAA